jgi:glutamyl-tRNA(Gln) amidotransferase subunit E
MTANDTSSSFLGPIGARSDAGIDWAAVGFKSGLEIHQQLLTERKLFCRCPAGRYSDDYDAEVLRHMRPTLSELGEYDGTALMEFKTKKDIIYRLHRDSVCTYEMDDTPPFEINAAAIDIALEIALLCGCKVVGELHVIRKQYLDGSIPAGFQRTAIVGVDGEVPFKGRTLPILQVSVEEDACREVYDRGHTICFLTDRLSMPLVEIVTGPELRTPSEVGEAALLLGNLMRTTRKVRRGLGATRQDVNVSVSGSTRIEIKGVPRIKWIPPLVRNEAIRQLALLGIRDQLAGNTAIAATPTIRAVHDLVAGGTSERLAQAFASGHAVKALRVSGGQAILHTATQPGRTFVDELAGRIRVIACLEGPPYLFVGPDGPDAPSGREWHRIRHRLRARKDDAVVLCSGPEKDVDMALAEVMLRFQDATKGVPSETRQAFATGLTDFERILPGPDRMYPDTDSPPTSIEEDRIERIAGSLPQRVWERHARLVAGGVPAHLISDLEISPRYALAERLLAAGHRGVAVGHLLSSLPRSLARKGLPVAAVPDETLAELAEVTRSGALPREALPVALRGLVRQSQTTDRPDLAATLAQLGLGRTEAPTDDALRELLAAAAPTRATDPEARHRRAMGVVMAKLRGRVDGSLVAERVHALHRGATAPAPASR